MVPTGQEPSLQGRAQHCTRRDVGIGVIEVKAMGGKECGYFLGAKWTQLGQLFKAAADLNSENREPRKDREQR